MAQTAKKQQTKSAVKPRKAKARATHHGVAATPAPKLPEGYVEFGPSIEGDQGISSVLCLFGGNATGGPEWIDTKGGGGTWEVVKRPYLSPLTVWRGPAEPYSHKLPLILDAYGEEETSQNKEDLKHNKEAIEAMAGMYMGQQYHQPPLLFLNAGGALPHDYHTNPALQWIIPEAPEWGEPIRNGAGQLVRQAVTITFMLYTTFEPGSSKPKTTPPSHRTASIFGKGESFESIAERKWPKKHWGKKLLNLNREQQPKEFPAHLNPSTTFTKSYRVLFPSAKEEKAWKKKG